MTDGEDRGAEDSDQTATCSDGAGRLWECCPELAAIKLQLYKHLFLSLPFLPIGLGSSARESSDFIHELLAGSLSWPAAAGWKVETGNQEEATIQWCYETLSNRVMREEAETSGGCGRKWWLPSTTTCRLDAAA